MNNYYTVTVNHANGSDEFDLVYQGDTDEIMEFVTENPDCQIYVGTIEDEFTVPQLLKLVNEPPEVFVSAYLSEGSVAKAFKKTDRGYDFYDSKEDAIDYVLDGLGVPDVARFWIDEDKMWNFYDGLDLEELPDGSFVRWHS